MPAAFPFAHGFDYMHLSIQVPVKPGLHVQSVVFQLGRLQTPLLPQVTLAHEAIRDSHRKPIVILEEESRYLLCRAY